MSTTPLPPPMSDADREAVFRSLPDMLEGFLKTWGWLHFAKGIETTRDAQWQAYAQQARADLEAENKRLREAIDHAEKVLSRQLDLISDRARGEYLDKRPVVSALSQHRKQLRAALKGTP